MATPDDLARERVRRFWARLEDGLRWYAGHSAVRLFRLTYREGVYLVLATGVLLVLIAVAAAGEGPGPYLLAALAVCYVLDTVLMNASVIFATGQPIHGLRSVFLALLSVANVALAFAVVYATERCAFSRPLSAVEAVYFSFVTMTTLGYGDIRPSGPFAWAAQLTVVAELLTGLFFVAAVLAVVVSWAKQSSK